VIWFLNRSAKIRWAREQAIPEIEQLYGEFNYTSAFQIALEAAKYIPEEHRLVELISLIFRYKSIQTDPPGADIYIKEYSSIDSDWKFLGQSPIDSIRMPAETLYRWKIEKAGYETVIAVEHTKSNILQVTSALFLKFCV